MDVQDINQHTTTEIIAEISCLAHLLKGAQALELLRVTASKRGKELAADPMLPDVIGVLYFREESQGLEEVLNEMIKNHSKELASNPNLGVVIKILAMTDQNGIATELVATTASCPTGEFLSCPTISEGMAAYERKATTTEMYGEVHNFLDGISEWLKSDRDSEQFPTPPKLDNIPLNSGIAPDAVGLPF